MRAVLLAGAAAIGAAAAVVGAAGLGEVIRAAAAWGNPGWEIAPYAWAVLGVSVLTLAALLGALVGVAVRARFVWATGAVATGGVVLVLIAACLHERRAAGDAFFLVAGALALSS